MTRVLPNGRILTVIPLFGGRARLTVGPDEYGYDEAW
jgi:hypothetical protein